MIKRSVPQEHISPRCVHKIRASKYMKKKLTEAGTINESTIAVSDFHFYI